MAGQAGRHPRVALGLRIVLGVAPLRVGVGPEAQPLSDADPLLVVDIVGLTGALAAVTRLPATTSALHQKDNRQSAGSSSFQVHIIVNTSNFKTIKISKKKIKKSDGEVTRAKK